MDGELFHVSPGEAAEGVNPRIFLSKSFFLCVSFVVVMLLSKSFRERWIYVVSHFSEQKMMGDFLLFSRSLEFR